MKPLVIGLDCSTTSAKALAVDANGKIAAQAQVPIPLTSPRPGWYEQDPADWWHASCAALHHITRRIHPATVRAIAIANQRETFVPLDAAGQNLRPAIVWLDERCKSEVAVFARKVGTGVIHRITGKPPDYAPVVYRLAWMKKHEPALFRRIDKVCDVHTYLVWRLSGSFKTSWASADPLGLFAVKSKRWSPELLHALGMRTSQMPEAFHPGAVLGRISEDAARETGLNVGTLIAAGGGDGQCAGLGSGALSPGRAYLNLGTAVVAGVYGEQYRVSTSFRTMCSCGEDGYYYECSLRAGTFAVDWLIRNILNVDPSSRPSIYRDLESEARSIAPGCDGLLHLPYLAGAMNPYWDMNARGAFIGLSAAHRRGHLYRSLLEGIAFEQLLAIRTVERELGKRVREFVVIGGGAANDLWCHILADVTGRKLLFPKTAEASALGAAIMGAVAAGWYPSGKVAAGAMTSVAREIHPNARNRKRYERIFADYRKLYPSLRASSS